MFAPWCCVLRGMPATMHFLSTLPFPFPRRNPIPRPRIFQPLEKNFPIIGKLPKNFSNHWKNRPKFSSHWKNIFQSLENFGRPLCHLSVGMAGPDLRAGRASGEPPVGRQEVGPYHADGRGNGRFRAVPGKRRQQLPQSRQRMPAERVKRSMRRHSSSSRPTKWMTLR